MFGILRRVQRVRQFCADLLLELVVIPFVNLRVFHFQLLVAATAGQVADGRADFLDLLVRELNSVQHLFF